MRIFLFSIPSFCKTRIVGRVAQENERLRVALEIESKARIAAEQMSAVLVARLESMTERATKAETKVEQLEQQHRELYKRIV